MNTIENEIAVAEQMIALYCRKKHKSVKKELCAECQFLFEYVKTRRKYCPFGEQKTFCSHCPVHCYKEDMRMKIKEVMRFSGTRMLFYNPPMAIKHLSDTIKHRRKVKQKEKLVAKFNKEKKSGETTK